MTTISAKIDNKDKTAFENICNSMGINIHQQSVLL